MTKFNPNTDDRRRRYYPYKIRGVIREDHGKLPNLQCYGCGKYSKKGWTIGFGRPEYKLSVKSPKSPDEAGYTYYKLQCNFLEDYCDDCVKMVARLNNSPILNRALMEQT